MGIKHFIEAAADAEPEPTTERPTLRTTEAAGGGVVLYEERDADSWLWADDATVIDVREREVAGDE